MATAFPYQAFALAKSMPNYAAWIVSFVITLLEISICILIASLIFLDSNEDDIFDEVFVMEGLGEVVRGSSRRHASCWRCIGGTKGESLLLCTRLVALITLAPLHLVPVVGTYAYAYVNGLILARLLHVRWFDHLGLEFSESRVFVKSNEKAYASFGVVASMLELVPLLNFITPVTNIVGAALWAANIEKTADPLLVGPRGFRRGEPKVARH